MLNDQTIELNFVRNRLETFQSTVLRDVQKRMSSMIDEVMQELRQHELQTNEFRNFATPHMLHNHHVNTSNTWSNRIRTETKPKTIESTDKEVSHEDDVKVMDTTTNATDTDSSSSGNKKRSKSKKYNALPEKIFVTRESFLTALLEVDHMKTIYHIFYIIFLVFLLNNITYEYLVKGR
ncbi:sterol O-acyltransferase 1-like [Lucilia cuprina]|uniref:sterol O-acyltransferase 1-like n=1 Tax=Lucilia cuprina TaxID=7375 RepID=UPI001F06E18E|nr:sterol O-acyltransferase 1-like [Lucilia cuprina]